MPSTPDPNYWGNPPQTPRSRNIPAQQAAPQQPTQDSASQPYPSEQSYGTEVPYADNQPHATTPAAPPAPRAAKKTSTGLIVAITIIVALVVTLGGCAACTAVVSLADNDFDSDFGQYGIQQDPSYQSPRNEQESLNSETRQAFGMAGTAALSNVDLDAIQENDFKGAVKTPDANGNYPAGVYRVGTDIPAGGYWFTGSNTTLSSFYILQPTSQGASTYNTVHINSYYGHNLMNLEEGEVFILDNDGTMMPLSQMSETFTAPYGSGVYRVGTDIPEGTYQLIVGNGANDYSACYVMADLDFDDSSYLYSDYFVKGDKPETITLEEGTYVELYNMQMRPAGMA